MISFSPAAWVPALLFVVMLAGWWLVRRSYFGTSEEFKAWRKLAKFILLMLGIYSLALWGYIALWWLGMFFFFKGY